MTLVSPNIYQALTIKTALKFYAKHGVRINRAYTPRNMMQMVTKITGTKLRPRDYMGGVHALENWVEKETGVKPS